MASNPLQFTTPVGRMIGGSIYKPRTTDYDGKPLVYKTGKNAGQPRSDFSVGVAFPKTPGATHWAQEPWLRPIYDYAHAQFPAGEAQRRDFSFKIIDGDSTEMNKANKRPCDNEGYPGHWIIWFSGSSAPRLYNANGTQLITDPDALKAGYYVQVFGNVTDNKPSPTPGLYMNHSMIALAGYGPEIVTGPDVSAAGFGQGVALPPGASTVPLAGSPVTGAPPAPPPLVPATAPAAVAPPPLPGGSAQIVPPPAATAAVPPPLVVTPNPAILGVPGGTPAAAPVAPPPAPPAPAADPVIEGVPLARWLAEGWTRELLVQHGKLAA